jgi:hypothetical protein
VPGGTGSSKTCVLYVNVPLGSTALRIFGDKTWSLNPFAVKATKLFAGWSLTSKPKAVVSGSVVGSVDKGDVMLTLDVSGKPGKWWILVESENESDVWVSAVAYDIAQRPRVTVEPGRRTGVIAVEAGASQIFRLQLPANKATTVTVNIDAGFIGSIGETYDVYVNIIDDAKIKMITDNLNFASLLDFLGKLAKAFKDGKVDTLFPKFLSPGPGSFDIKKNGNFVNFGKIDFPVPSSQEAPILYIAIQHKGTLPWSGALSSFTVQFTTTEQKADNSFDSATCENPTSRRRDVEQTTDACAGKVCADCIADANCNFCYGPSVPEQACRAKTNACPADSAPAVVAQCTECAKLSDSETQCKTVANCKWCSALSAGDPVNGCTTKWTCPDQATAPPTSQNNGVSTTTAGTSVTTTKAGASVDTTGSGAVALGLSAAATLVAAMLLC